MTEVLTEEEHQSEEPRPTPTPTPTSRFGVRARWITVVAVLVVAAAIAIWPHGSDSSSTSQGTISIPTPSLAAVRAQADLSACPTPSTSTSAGRPAVSTVDTPLAEATASCAANGQSVSFGSVIAEGPTLVNVWATWCAVCQTELPVLAQYASSVGAIKVLTMMVQSPEVDGLQSLASLHVHLPTVVDGNGSVSKALKLPVGLPASYLVRPDGTAKLIESLRVFSTVDEVRQAVTQYLGGQ